MDKDEKIKLLIEMNLRAADSLQRSAAILNAAAQASASILNEAAQAVRKNLRELNESTEA